MRLWEGRIDDCLLAPNGDMYYVRADRVGKTSVRSDDTKLRFAATATSLRSGPLDFVRRYDDQGRPQDLVFFAGRYFWSGFTHDTLERVRELVQRRSPLGGDSSLVSTPVFIGVRLDSLDQTYPIHVHPVCLEAPQAETPWHVFDETGIVVAVPHRDNEQRVELVHADRNDLRRTSPLVIEGHTVFERVRWTRDYILVRPRGAVVGKHVPIYGVRPDGTVAFTDRPWPDCALGFTPGGQPVYCETRPGSRGVFVGDRHYDFGLDGPTRGAVVSADGNTAAYWTVRNVVQFDLE